MSIRRLLALVLVILCIARANSLFAQVDAAPATNANVQVREWLIIVCDPYRPRANPAAIVSSSLPDFISTLRPKVAVTKQDQPSPIGVIRFSGQTDQKITVRLITRAGGIFYASWPDGRIRPAEVLWRDLTLASTPRQMVPLLASQWINILRGGSSTLVTTADHSEKFLLYDAEFPFSLPLKLAGGKLPDEPVQIANFGTTPLHDLVLYRPDRERGGWTSAAVGELASASVTSPTTAQAVSPSVRLTPIEAGDLSQFLMNDWRSRLAAQDLDPSDLELIVRTLKAQALDDRAMTGVFRLDETDLNRLLPLEITPRPARVTRVALVIARNIDPALPALIDQLITQLGNPDWKQREAATELLAGYGPAAEPKLRAALQNRDPEIVLRAERLLKTGVPSTDAGRGVTGIRGLNALP